MSSYEPDITMLFMLGGGVLFVWGFVRSVYLCFRKLLYGEERGRTSDDEPGEIYRIMSSARQEEIVGLRKNALLRYLSRFTLTLGDEHLLCCTGSQTDTTLSLSENEEVNDGSVTANETCKGTEKNGDIEKGNKDDVQDIGIGDMAQDSNSTATAADKYTHISIPLPGCDIKGIHICSLSMEAEKEDRQEGNKWKLPSLFQTGDDDAKEKQEPITIISDPNHHQQQQKVEKRNVPIFCAICLSEYEKCDRVCWSSNIECNHVFHEDCILQWLISSGKKRSMNEFFTRHPTDEKLLEHEFCPCCRQGFICVRPAPVGGEESV
mmetsp:Transcript_21479/g.33222  ORF Transcript_21479/g.33222 Transcript_21479/m.33222 type:complete len:321 (-) Transcript_21479:147-1109(-)